MDEEKRIITIYNDIDYDDSVDKLKETLKKYDAELVAANNDEYQISIAKSKLEDLANELDLDIDDITEEWDNYKPEEKDQSAESSASTDIASYVGKIDKTVDDFNANEFVESTRQNKRDASIRLQNGAKVYELYIDFEDKVYVELWRIMVNKSDDNVKYDSKLLYEKSFSENDVTAWNKLTLTLSKFFSKDNKSASSKNGHRRHHQVDSVSDNAESTSCKDFSVTEVLALDDIEECKTLAELEDAIKGIDESTLKALDKVIANKRRVLDVPVKDESCHEGDDSCHDAEYDYDEKLAKQIVDEILEGANADVPQHIEYAIESRGGNVETMRISPRYIHVIWSLGDFNADNTISLDILDKDVLRLAEDIAHAVKKHSVKAHDAKDDKHTVSIKNANMTELARICDMLDEANIKYTLDDNSLTVHCHLPQWKELQSRFGILNDEYVQYSKRRINV